MEHLWNVDVITVTSFIITIITVAADIAVAAMEQLQQHGGSTSELLCWRRQGTIECSTIRARNIVTSTITSPPGHSRRGDHRHCRWMTYRGGAAWRSAWTLFFEGAMWRADLSKRRLFSDRFL